MREGLRSQSRLRISGRGERVVQGSGNSITRDGVFDLCDEDQRQALDLINDKKRKSTEEPEGREKRDMGPGCSGGHANLCDSGGFRMLEKGECSRVTSVLFGSGVLLPSMLNVQADNSIRSTGYVVTEEPDKLVVNLSEEITEGNNMRNMNGQNQLVGHRGNLNPRNDAHNLKDKILGLELIARFVNRVKGSGRLTKIHGVHIMNATEGICPKRTLKEEILRENNAASPKMMHLEETDNNDAVCSVCKEGGDLVCCDGCPSTFHQSCLAIETLPSGDWYCMYCRCKFCGLHGGKKIDSFEDFIQSKISTCRVCDGRYHQSCLEASGANTVHYRQSLCGDTCKKLYEGLEKLLWKKHEIEDRYSLSFICRSTVDSNASQIQPRIVECNTKLAIALSILKEGFDPWIDHTTGIDLIHSVIYCRRSNIVRLDCKRFVTAILEKDGEIVSVASIRIHANQIAEMPYVSTRLDCRRQGMLRKLVKSIERALSSLNVELLVSPIISDAKKTWISYLGFQSLDLESKTKIKCLNLLVFPGLEILQKKIAKCNLFP